MATLSKNPEASTNGKVLTDNELEHCRQHFGLTAKDVPIAKLLQADCSRRQIAGQLGRSVGTINGHITRVFRKVGVDSRMGLDHALQAEAERFRAARKRRRRK